MSVTEKERIAFEKWVSDSGREHMLGRCHYLPAGYDDLTVHAWWSAWLARAELSAPADLVRRLLADHQRVEPHHADQCQLCREATAAIEGQPAQGERQPVTPTTWVCGKCSAESNKAPIPCVKCGHHPALFSNVR